MSKQDMSKECGYKDAEMHFKRDYGMITEEEFNEYWNKYCGRCLFMCDICMCGEETYL